MRLIIQIIVSLLAIYIAWSLFKTALYFLWLPLMMVVIAFVLVYLAMNQRK